MTSEKREISLPLQTWSIIDAMSDARSLTPSELLDSLIDKLVNFEQVAHEFNSPVKAVTIGGDTIEGDKVGGNKGNVVLGDVTGNVEQKYYVNCQQLTLQLLDDRFQIVLDGQNQLKLEPRDDSPTTHT